MAKGFFSQGVCLLTDGKTIIEDVRSALEAEKLHIAKQTPAREDWCFSGPSLIIPFRPEVNGYAEVDLVEHPWPDTMGDPKTDPMTFGAWSMGHFGPLAFPGGLARARQHVWLWEAGRTVPEGHRGFIRIRMSYVFGTGQDARVLPENYQPLAEMMFLSRVVLALLNMSSVLCYFNPNGEVLRDGAGFRDTWDACEKQQKIPLLLWMNIRHFNLNERFGLMDSVGNGQLEIQDVEAIYPRAEYDPGTISYYVSNVTHYLLDLDRAIKTGEAIDGPGESNLSWTIEVCKLGIVAPPRRVLRLYPKASGAAIREALAAAGSV